MVQLSQGDATKLRIALALTVLESLPVGLSIAEYCDKLQLKWQAAGSSGSAGTSPRDKGRGKVPQGSLATVQNAEGPGPASVYAELTDAERATRTLLDRLTMGQDPPRHLASVLEMYSKGLDALLGPGKILIRSLAEVDGLVSGVATALDAWAGVRMRESHDEAAQSFETIATFLESTLALLSLTADPYGPSALHNLLTATLGFLQIHSLPSSAPLLAPPALDALLAALSVVPPPQARILALASFLDHCLAFGIDVSIAVDISRGVGQVLGQVRVAERLGSNVEESLLWLLERAWTAIEGEEQVLGYL